jgi:hypothetical protein
MARFCIDTIWPVNSGDFVSYGLFSTDYFAQNLYVQGLFCFKMLVINTSLILVIISIYFVFLIGVFCLLHVFRSLPLIWISRQNKQHFHLRLPSFLLSIYGAQKTLKRAWLEDRDFRNHHLLKRGASGQDMYIIRLNRNYNTLLAEL